MKSQIAPIMNPTDDLPFFVALFWLLLELLDVAFGVL